MRPLRGKQFEFPGFSKGRSVKKCGIEFVEIEGMKELLLGSWVVRPFIPGLGVFLAVFGWMIGSYGIFAQFPATTFRWLTAVDFVLMVLFLVSFIRTISTGPGYFPFYWALGRDHGPLFDACDDANDTTPLYRDSPAAGVISNPEQLAWARSQPRPPRCIVARSAKRIVIRPDHYCNWSETWIGKRNQKFFLLYNLYGTLFIGLIGLCSAILIVIQATHRQWGMNANSIWASCGVVIASYFALFTGSFLVVSLFLILSGITNWEQSNKLPREMFDKGICKNIEDVFGPISTWATYVSPFHSPFDSMSNEQLVDGYPNYYDTTL